MLGNPITNGFTYRQAAIPTGAVIGQTWQQLNGSGVPVRELVFDGNFWRITGGMNGRQRTLWPVTGGLTNTGAATSSTMQTLSRRISLSSGASGTSRIICNTYVSGAPPILGAINSAATLFFFNFDKPIELITRLAARATGLLRIYLSVNPPPANAIDNLSARGFGVLINLATNAITLHLHDGTSLFTQAGTPLPAVGALDIEFCWDGVSRFGVYVNGVFSGQIDQSITGAFNACALHFAYDSNGAAAVAQILDLFVAHAVGGY